ncbi:MAG: hypothetical protein SNJ84_00570 [Verrucomicrobiia bacterium]
MMGRLGTFLSCMWVFMMAVEVTPLAASGTYRFVPLRPPVERENPLDEELYGLGRALFTGRIQPSGRASPALVGIQRTRLTFLQEQLPRSLRNRVDLPALAPALSPGEMAALEYFVTERYKINMEAPAFR